MGVSTSAVIQAWAHSDPKRRDWAPKGPRVSIRGDSLYSYETEIARHLPGGKVWVTTERYSVTTARHVSEAAGCATRAYPIETGNVIRYPICPSAPGEVADLISRAERLYMLLLSPRDRIGRAIELDADRLKIMSQANGVFDLCPSVPFTLDRAQSLALAWLDRAKLPSAPVVNVGDWRVENASIESLPGHGRCVCHDAIANEGNASIFTRASADPRLAWFDLAHSLCHAGDFSSYGTEVMHAGSRFWNRFAKITNWIGKRVTK